MYRGTGFRYVYRIYVLRCVWHGMFLFIHSHARFFSATCGILLVHVAHISMVEDVEKPMTLPKEQKTAIGFLAVITVLILVLWVLQMRYTIYSPFSKQIAQSAEDRFKQSNQVIDGFVEETRDTDQDGLTDIEEINLYGTSAYLPDTDSDGLTDYQEVMLGTDPNCPKDATCESTVDAAPRLTSTSTPFTSAVNGQDNPLDVLTTGAVVGGSTGSAAVTGELASIANNPEMIRALLLETGQFTKEDLTQIPDTTLIEIARSILEEKSLPASQ
jgi:hypothetical protein